MSNEPQTSKVSPRARRALILMVAGLPVGFFAGRWLLGLRREGLWGGFDPSGGDMLAFLLAAFLVFAGLVTAGLASSRKALGRRINGDDVRAVTPATSAQARFYAGQGLVLVLAGAMLAAPPLAVALFDPLSPLLASAVMTGLIALFLFQTVGNITLWIRSDELMRRAMAETAAVSFVLFQGLLFLWAAGEKLALLPALTLWDAFNVTMIGYLAISMLVGWRRGFAD